MLLLGEASSVEILIFLCLLPLPFLFSRSSFLFFCCCFFLGFFLSTRTFSDLEKKRETLLKGDVQTRLICDGFLQTDPLQRPQGVSLKVRLLRCGHSPESTFEDHKTTVQLFVRGAPEELWQGDVVRFEATFREPEDYHNPGSFSYRRYLESRDVALVGFTEAHAIFRVGYRNTLFQHHFVKLRHDLFRLMDSAMSLQASAIARTMMLGSRDDLDEETRHLFSLLGIAHILSISGLHVGFVVMIISTALSWLLRCFPNLFLFLPRQQLTALLSLPLLWIYVLFVGAPVAAVRAAMMLSMFLFHFVCLRRHDPFNTLLFAVFLMTGLWPLAMFDLSFQLSVVSLFGILISIRRVEKRKWLRALVATTGAFLFSAPLILSSFHAITPLGLVTNLIVIPWTGFLLMPFLIIASFLSPLFPEIAGVFWKISGVQIDLVLSFSKPLMTIAEHMTLFASPTFFQILLIYTLLMLCICHREPEGRGDLLQTGDCFVAHTPRNDRIRIFSIVFGMFLLAFSFLFPIFRSQFMHQLEITFFDVGHGDAILLRFPDGTAWMIDGGGLASASFDIGEKVIAPALWRLGVYSLETLVVSHPHIDHYGGLTALLHLFHPRAVLTSSAALSGDEEWLRFRRELEDQKLKITLLDDQTPRFHRGEVEVNIAAPHHGLVISEINNQSLVMSIRYRNISFLLTGDIESFAEEMIMRHHDLQPHTVLKVAHHGSKTSSTEAFLKKVSPQVAVISVGKHGRFRLPNESVIMRLAEAGIKIYRTDQHGAVMMRTDGEEVTLTTLRGLPRKESANQRVLFQGWYSLF